jgi:surface protein
LKTAYAGFQFDTKIVGISEFDTSYVTSMESLFYGCNKLLSIPQLDTSNVTTMYNMFYNCYELSAIPMLNTSKVTNMGYMFDGCKNLTTIPELDFSNVTNVNYMLNNCTSLRELPNMNMKKVTSLSGFLYSTTISKVGVIDCDSITNIQWLNTSNTFTSLTDLGGFRNLGAKSSLSGTNSNYFLYSCPNLTHQSLLNVLNLLYDRAAAGYSVITIKLTKAQNALLSDEEKAIATNKGWTITAA